MDDFIFTGEDLLNSILYVNENKTRDNISSKSIREFSLGVLRGNGKQRVEAVSKRLAHTLFTLSTNEYCLDLLSKEFEKPMDFFENCITTDVFPSQGDEVKLKISITEFSIKNRSIAFIIYMLTSFYHINKLHNNILPDNGDLANTKMKLKNQQLYDRYIDDLLLCTILSTLNYAINPAKNENTHDFRDEIINRYNNSIETYTKLIRESEENLNYQPLISREKEYKNNNLLESCLIHNPENDATKSLKWSSIFSDLSNSEIEDILSIIKFLFIGTLLSVEDTQSLKNYFMVTKDNIIEKKYELDTELKHQYIIHQKFFESFCSNHKNCNEALYTLFNSNINISNLQWNTFVLRTNIEYNYTILKTYRTGLRNLYDFHKNLNDFTADIKKINFNIIPYANPEIFMTTSILTHTLIKIEELCTQLRDSLTEIKKYLVTIELTKNPKQLKVTKNNIRNSWKTYAGTLVFLKKECEFYFRIATKVTSYYDVTETLSVYQDEFHKYYIKKLSNTKVDILLPTMLELDYIEKIYKNIYIEFSEKKAKNNLKVSMYKKLVNIEDFINQFHIVYYNEDIKTHYDSIIKTANLPYSDYINFLKSEIPNVKLK